MAPNNSSALTPGLAPKLPPGVTERRAFLLGGQHESPNGGSDHPRTVRLLHRNPNGGTDPEELERTEEYLKTHPKRRPNRAMIAAYCRRCLPQTNADCEVDTCSIWPYRPRQPGGPPKRQLSEDEISRRRERLAMARGRKKG